MVAGNFFNGSSPISVTGLAGVSGHCRRREPCAQKVLRIRRRRFEASAEPGRTVGPGPPVGRTAGPAPDRNQVRVQPAGHSRGLAWRLAVSRGRLVEAGCGRVRSGEIRGYRRAVWCAVSTLRHGGCRRAIVKTCALRLAGKSHEHDIDNAAGQRNQRTNGPPRQDRRRPCCHNHSHNCQGS